MPWDVREADGKHCVFKKDSDTPIKGGCHESRADAVKHMKALYAAEPQGSMKYNVLAFADVNLIDDPSDENTKWVKTWRYSSWDHPRYGKVEITPSTGVRFKEHFEAGHLGRQHLANYEHGQDKAKGYKAAGTILDIDPRDDGIYYKVQFTENALKEIRAGEWKYLSPEYDDAYIDGESGELYEDMPLDLALTNTPYFKGQAPLNFSEVFVDPEPKVDPPKTKGGNKVDDLLKKVFAELGVDIDDDASEEDVLAAATELNGAIEPLRRAKAEGERSRTFREAFPDEYKEMEKLRKTRVESESRTFAENYRRFTIRNGEQEFKSTLGFSELVIDEIGEAYKKFSDRSVSPNDLKKVLDLISDKGIVDYAEHGSSRVGGGTREFSEDPKMAFAEAVKVVMEEDNLEYEPAMTIAKGKYPDLYDEYLKAIPHK